MHEAVLKIGRINRNGTTGTVPYLLRTHTYQDWGNVDAV